MQNIQGKTALITGASSGIGEAFAYEIAAKGANLIITARTAKKLEALAADIISKYNVKVHVLTADLAQSNAAEELYHAIIEKGLTVDVLINNAGFGKWNDFLDEPLDVYTQMVELNINTLVKLTYLVLPAMLQKGSGGIINVASTGAFQPGPYIAVYCATKAFVLSFSEALYGEYYKKGITITALCPGNTTTGFQAVANVDASKVPADTPQKVARKGLKAFQKNKSHVVVGIDNFVASLLPGIAPRRLVIKAVANLTNRFIDRRSK